jgi:serine kinase of HPr protein (carbohydrate metabolism regulator)
MTTTSPTIHASAVLIGARAALVRGPSGSGKSRLALALLQAVPVARLVADDRVHIEVHHGRLLARPAEALRGLLEVRGLGLRRLPFEPVAVVGLVVDLSVPEAERLPQADAGQTAIEGIVLPRLAVAPGIEPLPMVLASMGTQVLR